MKKKLSLTKRHCGVSLCKASGGLGIGIPWRGAGHSHHWSFAAEWVSRFLSGSAVQCLLNDRQAGEVFCVLCVMKTWLRLLPRLFLSETFLALPYTCSQLTAVLPGCLLACLVLFCYFYVTLLFASRLSLSTAVTLRFVFCFLIVCPVPSSSISGHPFLMQQLEYKLLSKRCWLKEWVVVIPVLQTNETWT